MLQTAPENLETKEFERVATKIEGIDSLQHIHGWTKEMILTNPPAQIYTVTDHAFLKIIFRSVSS